MTLAFAEFEILQETPQLDYPEFLRLTLETLYHQNAEAVFSASESPIETIFVNTLALCFLRNSLPLVIVPRVQDILGYIKELDELIPKIHLLAKWYKEQGYEGNELMEHLALEAENGKISSEAHDHLRRAFTSYEWLNVEGSYHLAMQAGLNSVKVDRKGIRADIFLWRPGKAGFKLAVECDGFQWHRDKISFVRDRKRDRALQDEHILVRRYPGPEIYQDPIAAANDLFKYLFQHTKVASPFISHTEIGFNIHPTLKKILD